VYSRVTLNAKIAFLWHGCIHGNICNTHQVHDVDELKQHLPKVWHGLEQSVIDDAIDLAQPNFILVSLCAQRLWACVDANANGGDFKQDTHNV